MTDLKGDGSFDADKLKQFASRLDSAKADVDEAQGEYREIFKEVEDAGFNRKALKLVLQLKKQEISKAQDFLRSFENYAHALGLYDQTDMFEQQAEQKANGKSLEEASAA